MHAAARAGHVQAVAALRTAGATVDATDVDGRTPLHMAAGAGHADVVAALRTEGATMDAADKNGWTPLHAAALEGHSAVVAELLTTGAPVDAADHSGSTLFHAAARAGHAEVVLSLRKAGASVGVADNGGSTPLCVAKHWRRAEAMAALHQAGAAVDSADNRQVIAARPLPNVVDPPSPAEQALAGLQAAYDGLVAHPETLELRSLYLAMERNCAMNVRGLLYSHHMLLLAGRLGLFATDAASTTEARPQAFYEAVYLPVIGIELDLTDKLTVRAIIGSAAKHGLFANCHVPIMVTELHVVDIFDGRLQHIYQRLKNLEEAVENVGQHMSDTIQSLRGLQQQIRAKDRRAQKVALIKAAVKLGTGLAPLFGGALGVSVDVVAALADGTLEHGWHR